MKTKYIASLFLILSVAMTMVVLGQSSNAIEAKTTTSCHISDEIAGINFEIVDPVALRSHVQECFDVNEVASKSFFKCVITDVPIPWNFEKMELLGTYGDTELVGIEYSSIRNPLYTQTIINKITLAEKSVLEPEIMQGTTDPCAGNSLTPPGCTGDCDSADDGCYPSNGSCYCY